MKKIILRKGDKLSSKDVLRQVTEISPQRPMSVDEMRKRVHILDVLDNNIEEDFLCLEDAHHETLLQAMNTFPWNTASAALLQIIDDVAGAEKIKPTLVKAVETVPQTQPGKPVGEQRSDGTYPAEVKA